MANQREQQRRKCGNAMTAASKEGIQMPSLAIPHGLPMWRPKAQDYVIDLVPYIVPKKSRFASHNNAAANEWWYERRYFNHPRIGVAGDAIVCPARTFGKPCPICEHKKKLEETLRARGPKVSKQEFIDAMSPLNPKERQLFLVYDHSAKSVGIQLWEESFHNFGKQLTQKLTTARKELRDKLEVFFDPYGGFSLRIVGVEESGGQYKYTKFSVDEFIERKKGLSSAIYEHEFCLDTIPVEMPYKDIAKVFSAGVDAKDEDVEEENTDNTDEEENEEPEPDDSEDEEPDDEDEDSSSSSEVKKGMSVDFTYKGKKRTGKVVKVDDDSDLIHVKCGDRDKPYVVDKDEIKIQDDMDDAVDYGDDDEDEKPAKRGKKKSSDDDDDEPDEDDELTEDDDEEESDDEDEEEEEEEKPTRHGRKSKDDDEDDEEDEDDDDSSDDDDEPEDEDEEEEEKPARRGRPVKRKR